MVPSAGRRCRRAASVRGAARDQAYVVPGPAGERDAALRFDRLRAGAGDRARRRGLQSAGDHRRAPAAAQMMRALSGAMAGKRSRLLVLAFVAAGGAPPEGAQPWEADSATACW